MLSTDVTEKDDKHKKRTKSKYEHLHESGGATMGEEVEFIPTDRVCSLWWCLLADTCVVQAGILDYDVARMWLSDTLSIFHNCCGLLHIIIPNKESGIHLCGCLYVISVSYYDDACEVS